MSPYGQLDFFLEEVERVSNIKVYSIQNNKVTAKDLAELSQNFETALRIYGQLLQEKPSMTLEMLDEILNNNSQKEKFLQELPTFSKEQLELLLKSYKSIQELPTFSKAMFEDALKAYMQEKRQ